MLENDQRVSNINRFAGNSISYLSRTNYFVCPDRYPDQLQSLRRRLPVLPHPKSQIVGRSFLDSSFTPFTCGFLFVAAGSKL